MTEPGNPSMIVTASLDITCLSLVAFSMLRLGLGRDVKCRERRMVSPGVALLPRMSIAQLDSPPAITDMAGAVRQAYVR